MSRRTIGLCCCDEVGIEGSRNPCEMLEETPAAVSGAVTQQRTLRVTKANATPTTSRIGGSGAGHRVEALSPGLQKVSKATIKKGA